jgi:hypothetical protein
MTPSLFTGLRCEFRLGANTISPRQAVSSKLRGEYAIAGLMTLPAALLEECGWLAHEVCR